MTCAFVAAGTFGRPCGRPATYRCNLCGDYVCEAHAIPEFHFHVRKVEP